MRPHPPTANPQLLGSAPVAVDVVRCFEAALAWGAPALLWHGDGNSWVAVGAVSASEALASSSETDGVDATELAGLPSWVAALPFDAGHPQAGAHGPLPAAAQTGRWRPALVLAGDGRHRLLGAEGQLWLERLRQLPGEGGEGRPWSAALAPIEGRVAFESRVAAAVACCDGQPIQKLVLARSARAQPAAGWRFSVGATLRALMAAAGSAVVFAVAGNDGAAFVGASPETLVRVRGRHLQTTALAGTRALGVGAEDSLLTDPKERAEHAAVVTGIRAALAPISEAVAAPSGPSVRRLPGMLHLETPISARLSAGVSAWDAVAALHPTPALGGWPRAEALAWLRSWEPLSRGLFAGPVGWVAEDGSAHFVVAIRSAWVSPIEAALFAGAGVVAGSKPEAEWRETTLKMETVRGAMRMEPVELIEDCRRVRARERR